MPLLVVFNEPQTTQLQQPIEFSMSKALKRLRDWPGPIGTVSPIAQLVERAAVNR